MSLGFLVGGSIVSDGEFNCSLISSHLGILELVVLVPLSYRELAIYMRWVVCVLDLCAGVNLLLRNILFAVVVPTTVIAPVIISNTTSSCPHGRDG